MLAAKLALKFGLACSTGGGTHHAFPSHGSGFCLLNDLAITAKDMTVHNVVHKILIVDLDVHQVKATVIIIGGILITTSLLASKNIGIARQICHERRSNESLQMVQCL